MKFNRKLGLLLLFGGRIWAAEPIMEVIPLQHRSGAEIQTLLQPLLAEGETIVDNHNSVIVKTLPARLENLRQTISKLDTPIQNLLISVMSSSQTTVEILNASDNANGMQGFNASTQTLDARQNLQQLRTLDGHAARIESRQLQSREDVDVYESVDGYRGFSTRTNPQQTGHGFSLTPHLLGHDEVMIAIEPWSDRMTNEGSIASQYINTTLRVRLGEWIDIAGGKPSKQPEWGGLNHDLRSNDAHLFIKVEKINR